MAAADATHAALRGDRAAVPAYAAQCVDIRAIYRRRVQAHYAEERRWPEADFWRTVAWDSRLAANADDAAIPRAGSEPDHRLVNLAGRCRRRQPEAV